MTTNVRLRKECPPGACICERDTLHGNPQADARILLLTREEEQRLLARIERIGSYTDFQRMQNLMREQLGLEVDVTPSMHGVRTVRGLDIRITPMPGLCRKTRQALPTAIRRCFENNPAIVYDLLNARDLLGGA
ncbi:hypothetical protein [Verticiella sediminum]|nr:hypothetical protein [Verticiella sediminum]